ncbi:tetratricopeptide repeat protein [Actibacterium sp. MT2.3-13A]|uniref:tetratricopeptide repeat protein n=1 Tax=Actibacterium sp. MT2.3-13A TaxID=2828332 RepID=UPI001BA4FE7B|nr:tetratricopeptide repeat protein [Actibacterium sp. MT2.3-13A]
MRLVSLVTLCLGSALALSACQKAGEAEVDRAVQDVIAGDESSLNDIMLTVADPDEAVVYFKRVSAEKPDRIDFQRGLAKSLIRAHRQTEAVAAWRRVSEHPEATSEDRVDFADALIRTGEWNEAEAVLDAIPPTHETYKRYRLEAMVADSNREWGKADSFYETAVGLTTKPSGVLNNWGYSKLTRGDFREAERLFLEAIGYDQSLFTAKNNLVLARGAQRNYQMPVMPMTQIERAQLLHTLALSAIKQGDVAIGKGLLEEAIETHPQHFEAAVRSLRALDSKVVN